MGLFGSLFGGKGKKKDKKKSKKASKARSGSYGKIVAWVEAKYGKINSTDSYADVKMKFDQALDYGRSQKGEKAVAGLKRYVEKGYFKDLIEA